MVRSISLLRNIGRFENVNAGAQLAFSKLTVIYAENARGKSTIAAIMRSLASGRAELVNERARLGSAHTPHIVIDTGTAPPAMFQNGNWNRTMPDVVVFDDAFVADNVCSGIEVGTTQRQNLHELIVGAQGIALARTLQAEVDRIELHNRDLREKESAIPADKRGALSIDQFCELKEVPDLQNRIEEAQKRLAAAQASGKIATAALFEPLGLPRFEAAPLGELLAAGLPELEAEALRRVQLHIARLEKGGEAWVGQGLVYADRLSSRGHSECPFCAQDLETSPLIAHYRGYFSEAYNALRQRLVAAIHEFRQIHSGDVPAAFERSVRTLVETHNFWKSFADLPQIEIDTAAIARSWKSARETVERLLDAKMASPLESMSVSADALRSISEHNAQCDRIREISDQLAAMNAQLALIKEQSKDANTAVLASDLANLKAVEARYDPTIKAQCEAYVAEKTAKAATERKRNAARQALDQHRQAAFPAYGVAINEFLRRFNANFRVGPIDPVNNRGGSAANYTVLIDNHPVPLAANAGEASFRNTLSAGDRNTLALAFFFACLEQSPKRAQAVVVIDDPMTSLDENRTFHTIQEIDRLARDVSSMIVLSHSKPFLFQVWDKCRQIQKTSLEVARSGQGSTLTAWNVTADMISEHEKRHSLALVYLQQADRAQERKVAENLRPMLEAFCRVAYPHEFLPNGLLGPFHNQCQQRLGTAGQIMDAANTAELRDLLDYANRYHHDSNPAYATEIINDATLTDFTCRTLRFIKRP